MNPRLLHGFATVALLWAPLAAHAEKTVARKDLPAAVEKTVAKEVEGATLRGISSEPCEGAVKETCYEVETMRAGRSRDLVIDPAGAVVEIEEALALTDLPGGVTRSASSLGKVIKAEKVTHGAETSYELLIEKAGRKSERAFLEDGTPKK